MVETSPSTHGGLGLAPSTSESDEQTKCTAPWLFLSRMWGEWNHVMDQSIPGQGLGATGVDELRFCASLVCIQRQSGQPLSLLRKRQAQAGAFTLAFFPSFLPSVVKSHLDDVTKSRDLTLSPATIHRQPTVCRPQGLGTQAVFDVTFRA